MRYAVCSMILATLALGACGTKEDAHQDATATCDVLEPGAAVAYAAIAPIVSACAECHGGASPSAGVRFDSYENASKAASFANDEIQAGRMPPEGGLAACERDLFQAWIDGGKLP